MVDPSLDSMVDWSRESLFTLDPIELGPNSTERSLSTVRQRRSKSVTTFGE